VPVFDRGEDLLLGTSEDKWVQRIASKLALDSTKNETSVNLDSRGVKSSVLRSDASQMMVVGFRGSGRSNLGYGRKAE